MAEYIERTQVLQTIELRYGAYSLYHQIRAMPAADVVPRAAYEQVAWERDIAIKQLEECGIPFGGKADVAPVVHGRWVSDEGDVLFHCSVCETQISTSWDYDCDEMWNFCPHCGADMRGE